LRPPGFAFATAISSFALFAPNAGWTSSRYGADMTSDRCVKSRSGWYGTFGITIGLNTSTLVLHRRIVWPSGFAFDTISAPAMPPPPGRLSITIG
jgi:hypothetical protein